MRVDAPLNRLDATSTNGSIFKLPSEPSAFLYVLPDAELKDFVGCGPHHNL